MIVELRQYTLHPGQRDVLIDLFESTFIEPQLAAGMQIPGTFRDLDDPDRFVWFRTFPDMDARKQALTTFYSGPIWKANRDAANATMIDSDNVLLLRPVNEGFAFPARVDGPSLDLIVYELGDATNALSNASARPLLRTEHAKNSYPSLPVRENENVLVSFTAHDFGLPIQQRLRLEPTRNSVLR